MLGGRPRHKKERMRINEDRLFKTLYESALRKDRWFSKARELLATAAQSERRISEYWRRLRSWANEQGKPPRQRTKLMIAKPQETYFMLVAYAIENLCKGHLGEQGTLRPRSEGSLPRELKEHDLYKLVQRSWATAVHT